MKISSLSLAALLATTAFAQAYPGSTTLFAGVVFITSATPACAIVGLQVGTRFNLSFRHKVASDDAPDMVTFYRDGSMAFFTSADQSGSLQGPVSAVGSGSDVHIGVYDNLPAVTNLNITPFGTLPLNSSNNIRINGTITGYAGNSGCTVGIRSSLTQNPN